MKVDAAFLDFRILGVTFPMGKPGKYNHKTTVIYFVIYAFDLLVSNWKNVSGGIAKASSASYLSLAPLVLSVHSEYTGKTCS